MAKFFLDVGIRFRPSEIKTKAIRDTIKKAIANTAVKIEKVSISPRAVQDAFKNIKIRLTAENFRVTSGVGKNVASVIRNTLKLQKFPIRIDRASLERQIREVLRKAGATPVRAARAVAGAPQATQAGGITGTSADITKTTRGVRNQASALRRLQARASETRKELARLAQQRALPQKLIENFRASSAAITQFNKNVTAGEKANFNFQRLLQQGGTSAEFFGAKIAQVTQRFGAYLISIRAIFLAQQAFNASLQAIVNFDEVIQDLNKVLQATPARLRQVSRDMFQVADATGRSINEVAESLGNFVRQGISVEEALERTQAALVAVNISELNANEATKFITSSLRIFGEEVSNTTQVLDLLSVTSDNAATTAGEVGRAFLRSASAAAQTGVSFRELLAIIAATIEQTQLSGQQIGTALKTITTRIVSNADALRQQANAFGANIRPGESVTGVLQELARIFPNLNKEQRTQIGLIVAGRRQFNIFAGIVESLGKANELLVKQLDSSGAAAAKNEEELEKLSTRARILGNNLAETLAILGGVAAGAEGGGAIRETLAALVNFTNDLVVNVKTVIEGINNLSLAGFKALTVFKAIGKTAFFGTAGILIRGIISGFTQFLQIGGVIRGLFAQIAAQEINIGKAVQQTNIITQREVSTQRNRLTFLQKILDTTQRINAARRGGGFRAGVREALEGGGRVEQGVFRFVGALALVSAIQTITDNFSDLSDSLEAAGGQANKLTASFIDIGTNATNLGTTFGLLTGSVKVGLIGALASATLQLINFARRLGEASGQNAAIIDAVNKTTLTFGQSLAQGGELLKQGFLRNITTFNRSGVVDSTANALDSLRTALEIASQDSGNLSAAFEQSRRIFENISNQIANAVRGANIARELQEFTQDFRRQRLELTTRLETGDVGGEFDPLFKASSEFVSNFQRLAPEVDNLTDAFAKFVNLEEAALQLEGNRNATARQILTAFNLQTEATRQLVGENAAIKEEANALLEVLENQLDPQRRLTEGGQNLLQVLQAGSAQVNDLGFFYEEALTASQLIQDTQNQITSRVEKERQIRGVIESIQSRLVEGEKALTEQFEEDAKLLIEIQKNFQSIINTATLLNDNIAVQNRLLKDQNIEAARRAQFQAEIIRETARSNSIVDDFNRRLRIAREEAFASVRQQRQEDERRIRALREEERTAIKANNKEAIKGIREQIEEFERVSSARLESLTTEASIQLDVEARKISLDALQESRKELTEFEINSLRQIQDQEQRVAQRRIDFIKSIGDSRLLEDIFSEPIANLNDTVQRAFGNAASLVISEQNRISQQTIQSIFRTFQTIEGSSASTVEKLRAGEEARTAIIEEAETRRQNIIEDTLEATQTAADRANVAEQRVIAERNKIPPLNARIIQAEKSLASARAGVQNATRNLFDAFQQVADATAQLQFDVASAAVSVLQETGAFGSVAAELSAVAGTFRSATSNIVATEETILQIRQRIADESLRILQNQFGAFRSLGIRAATAGTEAFNELQRGIETAEQIQRQGDIRGFSPEEVAEALNFQDIFPGIERIIASEGLQQLGIAPSILEGIESQMLSLAQTSAESGQAQVNAAQQQVATAREQLVEAREGVRTAKSQLNVAEQQREIQLRTIANTTAQATATRSEFRNTQTVAIEQLRKLNTENTEANVILNKIDNKIASLVSEIQTVGRQASATLSSPVPNAAGGSLSTSEIFGLINAARKEKSKMPPGSNLMLANTSEVVLNRKQARMIGLQPRKQTFAADGNANTAALERSSNALLDAVNTFVNKLNDPAFIEQDINVQVDSERSINVRGLDGIEQSIQNAFESRVAEFAPREEVEAIGDTVRRLVDRLANEGIVQVGSI